MYQDSLRIKEDTFGHNHPDVADTIYNMAIIHKTNRDYSKALAMYQDALNIYKSVHGDNHPNVINVAKQVRNFALVSTIVTVNYITKVTMNMVSNYIADYFNEFLSSFSSYFYGNNDLYGNETKDTENVESVIEATYTDLDSDNVNMMGGAIKEEPAEIIELQCFCKQTVNHYCL